MKSREHSIPKTLSLVVVVAAALGMNGPSLSQTPVKYENQFLWASDVSETNYWFGFSVAIDGDTALIGRWGDMYGNRGSVFVFTRNESGVWIERAKLEASDGAREDYFGTSVALQGTTALIGSPGDDNERGESAGSIYVFILNGQGDWIENQKIVASDGSRADHFGTSVTIDDQTAVIGAPFVETGAAYVFEQNADGDWLETAKLVPSAINEPGHFAETVDIQNDTAVIGAPFDYHPTVYNSGGSAFVFERDEQGNWHEREILRAWDAETDDHQFGAAVSVDDRTIFVGAYWEKNENGDAAGATYVFNRDESGNWTGHSKLIASDGGPGERFGISVALQGDAAIIGADLHRYDGQNKGCAYVFVRDGRGEWIEHTKLLASNSAPEDEFGGRAAWDGDTALVSAYPKVIIPYYGNGMVYVFDMSEFGGPADVTLDVKPSDPDNVINRRSRGRFWVAILSEDDFDALRVDPASIRLGAGAASPDNYRVRDSNYDGVADLLVRFRTPRVGIVCGDTSIELTGQTYDGVEIVGEDDLRTVGCKKPKREKKGKKK